MVLAELLGEDTGLLVGSGHERAAVLLEGAEERFEPFVAGGYGGHGAAPVERWGEYLAFRAARTSPGGAA